ncbi:uncharacterized protein LOC133778015 isoform X2 [Humulus lupulus]|uniref:uncharacterized protein LOC133778015 isoform X2 n=1 Tax=Humulus lupulus TaxID=3486 RepID=UPI002B413C1F|nr:uncharacterized protein LOC133778015 isoform X2 [Humulus lupulus]
MLEDQVAYLLQRYLGNYVRGLNKEALKISVWQGDVELTNMQLKPEALNALKLPVKVKAGFLGSVKLKVPWSRLGQDPVVVHLDRIFLLVEPATQVEGSTEDAIQEAKKSRVREMEMKLVEKAQQLKSEVNQSWLGSLINTIVGNLKLSISNIHIRYEDSESNPGHPFAAGVTLEKLLAVTVDDNGNETFITGGSLDRIQKSVELDRLALYLDSDIIPWHIDKPWEDLLPSEWVQVFRYGTKEGKPADRIVKQHTYILEPITGNAKYTKLRANELAKSDQPLQNATVNLDDVILCLSKDGYKDMLKLADNFSAFNQRLKYAHFRPHVSVKSDPRSWWKYAYRAVSDQVKKGSGKLPWEQVLRYARLRKKYISLYASLLKSEPSRVTVDDNKDLEDLDRELDIEVILQWRMLAHKFVQKSTESVHMRKEKSKKSWWSFAWSNESSEDETEPFHFGEEDWEQLNKIIGYKEGDDNKLVFISDKADALQTSLNIYTKHSATKLIDGPNEYLAELSCEGLHCFIKLYPETKIFNVKLGSYRLSSPNGLLAESATNNDSLLGVFCYKPFDMKVDWSMVAKASPCYVTYMKDTIDQIINFFQSSTAVSQTLALEAAAAVQMTIDEVRRTAQEQVNKALKNQSRFLLDIDIAAPKITIPTDFCPDNRHSTKLMLDLGNLVIRTEDEFGSSKELDMYLQFNLVLRDVSAFLVDGDYHWGEVSANKYSTSSRSNYVSLLPVIDNCGAMLKLQQIRMENASYPSTRLAIRLPSLGFHFSPARYHRLMQIAKLFKGEDAENSDFFRPWNQADFEGWLSLLTRKGVGNREAVWQRRYFCLVGPFLYVLDNPGSKSYKQYISLRGKQISRVLPEVVDDADHVLAVCDSARSDNKVVEDANALILQCESDDSRKTWQSRLQGAIYRASASAPITTLSETSSDADDSEIELDDKNKAIGLLEMEKIFITGVLDELKVCFSYSDQHDHSFFKVLLTEESRLFEFRAIGGQVEVSIRAHDMFIGTVLKSLEIEDLVSLSNPSRLCYVARSFIGSKDAYSTFVDERNHSSESNDLESSEGDDKFYEAQENLVDSFDSQRFLKSESLSYKLPSFTHISGLLPQDVLETTDDVVHTDVMDSFVKAQIVICDQNSPRYNNIDAQVTITLATLSFFCRRPTILAIMEFVNAINAEDESCESFSDNSPGTVAKHGIPKNDMIDEHEQLSTTTQEAVVKGLLGKGKSRVVFNITLNMKRAQILLLNEDETKLSSLSQDNLLMDIKVFPSSFSIKASLGNLRISDDSLPENHMYFWACDMRNPGGSSFVELDFTSFSTGDEDYRGYEYSFFGELSEVRIVYLNRFIQEVVGYFMGLVPNDSKGVAKLKDQLTNSERWFTTSEIEGSPAVKLDVSLRQPIILMPRRTDSLDYLKLDIVHITVQNTFEWCFGSKTEINAVHLEVLTIQVEDIHLNVGTGTDLGESIIHDVRGISIVIQRSLRDLLHQIPNTEIKIKIEELKAALSNKEYHIITECAVSNISETPRAIPQLNHNSVTPVDVVEAEPIIPHDIGVLESQSANGEVWIVTKVSVFIGLVELRLYTAMARDAPLATVQVSGAWLLYKSSSVEEGSLSATLKGFTVCDDREGTDQEFRLAIGKPENIGSSPLHSSSSNGDNEIQQKYDQNITTDSVAKLDFTMLILDVKLNKLSTFVSLCIQRPQLLVALDFLLAVVEFFVPTIGSVMNNEEGSQSFQVIDALILNESVYKQPSAKVSFSPQRPLVVDDERYDHFVYDGGGGILDLKDRQGFNLTAPSTEAIIYVGRGKKLQFKNIVIKNGLHLDSCISLGSNSSYSASEDDHVYREGGNESSIQDSARGPVNELPSQSISAERSTEFIIELQAIGPELTFYNTSKDVGKSPLLSNQLLHAQLDAFCRLVMKGETMEMSAKALGLTMESNGIRILEPFDTSISYSNATGKTNIHVSVSDIFMNFSFSILRLFLAVEEDILAFLRMTAKKMTVICSQFDKVGMIKDPGSEQVYAFWRPHAPPGFAILGDFLTPLDKPPTKGVIVVNSNYTRVKRPVSFKLIWPPSESGNLTYGDCCSVWFPEAPKGYVALGCVVSPGRTQPPLSSTFCISASLVCSCSLRDYIAINTANLGIPSVAFWRVENSIGTFLPADPTTYNLIGRAYDLRHIMFGSLEASSKTSNSMNTQASSSGDHHTCQSERLALNSAQHFEAVATFQWIWWNQGSNSRKQLSIWRPVVPLGMVYFGDVAVKGYEPPHSCIVLRDTDDEDLFKTPLGFQLVGQIKKQRGMESMSFWLPQAPPGFVSLGCIACKGTPKSNEFSTLRCMRSDLVTGDQFLDESLWESSDSKVATGTFSLWAIGNELGTFIVRSGFKKPPKRYALKLADTDVPSASDDTVIDAEIRTFSAALFDDYGGLMVPLFNASLSGIGFSLHGKKDYLNSTVNFSLAARSYNDKYESWEPLVEPVDGFLRYQYDLSAPGAASQLRLTSTRDLNLNISVSNANMIIQAYASWNNLGNVQAYHATTESFSPSSGGRSIIDVHHKKNYHIIPKNKLGQDIFIKATELRGLTNIIRMPSGDMKPIKVPVSKNMLDSHLKGKLYKKVRPMIIVAIADAELPRMRGLTSPQYTVAIRLTPDRSLASEVMLQQQSARTCGSSSDYISSENELVKWNEVFFFKVDSAEHYTVELIVTDIGRGVPVGFFSSPLKQMAVEENPDAYDHLNRWKWIELTSVETSNEIQGEDCKESCGRVRCCIILSPRSETENDDQSAISNQRSGFVQISPTREGPWTTVRLNYAAPAACWRLGNDVVASEVSIKDGNRYVNIRSLVSVSNATEFVLELCLASQASRENMKAPNDASDLEGVQVDFKEICIGSLRPGDTVHVPLSALKQTGVYALRLRPCKLSNPIEYSWSSLVERFNQLEDPSTPFLPEGISVSSLVESEELLYCTEISGTSSSSSQKMWFSVIIKATEIAKDIRSDPIQDWNLVVKSPLSITNFLPLVAEFSVLEMQKNGNFVVCSRGVFGPGKTVNVHNADIRNPLFFSLLPNRGWLPVHEAVPLSHTKTISLRSSITGRVVQIILEQNFDNEQLLHAKIVRVYAPYWLDIARCPSLTCRLIDVTGKRHTWKFSVPFHSKKNNEVVLEEITDEEMHEGHTITSTLNFKLLGIAVSIAQSGKEQFGPIKDLSPLGDMDGAVDLYAFDEEGNCMQLSITTKSSPFPSIPTKVISIRPFMTFTNRVGQDILVKLSSQDEPKILRASDSRVSFSYRQSGGPDKLQVQLEGTNWSFPVQIIKEDTLFLTLRRRDGSRIFLRTEIRGYEEGSRFIIVFRLGSTDGPIRIENRTKNQTISICQSGFDEDTWVHLEPLSTTNFSWEDPYGQQCVDAKVISGSSVDVWKIDLERVGLHAAENEGLGLQFHAVEIADTKVVWFTDKRDSGSISCEEIRSLALAGKWEHSYTQNNTQNNTSPIELIIEVGVIGISIIDHRPKELSYIYLERVFISYLTGYDGGTTSRFKLILGHLQLDNQLPLTLMPVLLAPEAISGTHNPFFKMTITMRNENTDGIQVYPYVYIRVNDKTWRFNIHEPIIWALVDFYNNLHLDRLPKSSSVIEVDPEIHIGLIDVSEVRMKLSLETAPAQRPHGILGVWSPILSAVGNAFKIQVHLRRVMHKDRFMRRSSISSAIGNRIFRDLIHNPLHLIFSVDVLGMTSSTLASLSRGFAELSTDGQFMQLRSKQVWSRKITGVGDGIIQGTEAFAQGVAFGISGVVKRPMENARQNGLLGLAHGLGQAFIGFFAQPVSGALDFFSLTVDGIGASCSKCLEALNSKTTFERVRNPRAIHSDNILREYCEKEALGQMVLYLAEASRHFGCTEIFKEPSKFAWSDYYEEHFVVPHKKIVLVTNKRVMLLQCQAPDKMDKKPCKIMWDVPWEELMALELAKAGCNHPSHLILHLKNFGRSENFVRVIKCNAEESGRNEPQAIRICSLVRKMWKTHQSDMKSLVLKVPASQRLVHFAWNEADGRELQTSKSIIRSRELLSGSSASDERRFVKHGINFRKIWSSELESKSRITLSKKQVPEDGRMCTIWRPICPDGYVSIGDIARIGSHPPNVAAVYSNVDRLFALPMGYDLVWRNCLDDYVTPLSIWLPRAPEGYVSPGCIAVERFEEPEPNAVYCVAESLTEDSEFEEQKVWSAPDSYPWACHIYQVKSDALHFVALRQSKEESDWRSTRVLDDPQSILQSFNSQ